MGHPLRTHNPLVDITIFTICFSLGFRCSEKLVEVIEESVESGRSLEMKYVSTDYITDVVFFSFFGITVKKEWLKQNSELRRIQDAMAFPELITQVGLTIMIFLFFRGP
jgi:hypothetical protein